MNYLVQKVNKPLHIAVEVPGSKSITNRALLIGAMADGLSEIQGILFSDDSRFFLKALQELGFEINISEEKKTVRIQGMNGRIPKKEATIQVGSAGTAARFLTAFLAMSDGTYQIESSEQMKKRPMKDLLLALEGLGASFAYLEEPYHFPMKVTGMGINTEKCSKIFLNIDQSSQFLSALLMVAPVCLGKLEIELTGHRNARSYVEMTQQMMMQFGHPGVRMLSESVYQVQKHSYKAQVYQVEPDVSAACYFYAMAAITGGEAMVYHMRKDSLQGDMRFLKILEQMGCTGRWELRNTDQGSDFILQGPEGGRLKGITADFSDFSDQALTMAAIAPYADSPVRIDGIGHIRGQESDRVTVICTELKRIGIDCKEEKNSVTIYPGVPKDSVIHTYDDHRVAMAFAVTGLRMEHLEIEDPMCCKKTFQEYFEKLDAICH